MSPTSSQSRALAEAYLRASGIRLTSTSPAVANKSKPYDEPRSLTIPLWFLVGTLCLMVVGEIVILLLAGIRKDTFGLPDAALIALASGLSVQYWGALVSPLAKNIANIVLEQIKRGS